MSGKNKNNTLAAAGRGLPGERVCAFGAHTLLLLRSPVKGIGVFLRARLPLRRFFQVHFGMGRYNALKETERSTTMELHGHWRHELKYQIGPAAHLALRQRLRTVMEPDPHAGADGLYTIRSVYFDNYRDKALREKLDGVQTREKFRIRYYNDDLSFITLEKKIKHNDLCQKLDAPLSREEYQRLLRAPGPWMLEHPQELVRELYCKMQTQQLRPRVLVSYVREPYVYAPGNVRVTFDSDIRTSLFGRDFAGGSLPGISTADDPGDTVLEVKYDAFLPEIIRALLQTEGLRQQAFSKYGACRRFG